MPTSSPVFSKKSGASNIVELFVVGFLIFLLLVSLILLIRKGGRFLSKGQDVQTLWSRSFLFQKLIPHLIIGLSVSYVIVFFPHMFPKFIGTELVDKEDSLIDLMMEFESYNIPTMAKNIPRVVLLDIDQTTYEQWGEPMFTPRHKLTNLIDAAVMAKARLVVVDVLTSGLTDTEKKSPLHPHDQKLHDYLEEHVKQCKENQVASCVPIILVRAFNKADLSEQIREPKKSFLEDVVTPSAPYLQWGSAQFSFYEDNVWRRWRLWESTCTGDQPEVTPSIALLVTGMSRGCEGEIQKALHPFEPNCESKAVSSPSTSISFCGLTINTNDRIQQRVRYSIPWSYNDDTPMLPHIVSDNNDIDVLTIFEAYPYAESPPQAGLESLENKIVVIGGSYLDSKDAGDIHLTPIGTMPGSLVIINAIYSLLQNQIIRPAPIWALLVMMTIFIVITTIISQVPSHSLLWKVGRWMLVIMLLIASALISYFIFGAYGMWFNIAIPLILIELLQIVDKLLEKFIEHKQTVFDILLDKRQAFVQSLSKLTKGRRST